MKIDDMKIGFSYLFLFFSNLNKMLVSDIIPPIEPVWFLRYRNHGAWFSENVSILSNFFTRLKTWLTFNLQLHYTPTTNLVPTIKILAQKSKFYERETASNSHTAKWNVGRCVLWNYSRKRESTIQGFVRLIVPTATRADWWLCYMKHALSSSFGI